MASDLLKRLKPLIEAGLDLTKMTPARAEAIVRDLVKQGEVHRLEAASLVQTLVERGRQATEKIADHVRREVTTHLQPLTTRVEALEAQVAELAALVGQGAQAERPATKAPARKAPVKKAGTKTSSSAKKAPAKKASATKAAAKKPSA